MVSSFSILAYGGRWHTGRRQAAGPSVLPVESSEEWTPDGLAAALAEMLREQGYRGEGLVLGIPSAWCLCAQVRGDGLPRKHARQALLYRLEEKLPIATESFVADFVSPVARDVLGIAVPVAPLKQLVDALEAAGVTVQAICPTSLLALAGQGAAALNTDVMIWAHDQACEFLWLAESSLTGWETLGTDAADLRRALRLASMRQSSELRVSICGQSAPAMDELSAEPGIQVVRRETLDVLASATAAAGDILAGRGSPMVDLRRDALMPVDRHRQLRLPLCAVAVSFIVAMFAVSAALLQRASRFDDLAGASGARQAAAYRELFPNQPVPISIRSRLSSEERKLRALCGELPEASQQTSALAVLCEVLVRLPTNMRYRIHELRCTPDRVLIEGQARTHGDAESLTAALRHYRGLQLESPRTEQMKTQGVAFVIAGTAVARPHASGEKP